MTVLTYGASGYHWLNFGIIQYFTQPLKSLPMKLCMVKNLLSICLTFLVNLKLRWLRSVYKKEGV